MSLPIPAWGPNILTGPSKVDPSPAALRVLKSLVKKHLQTDRAYSVTYSVVLCPAGPNYLYTIRPYYWEVSPGKWEHRDGQRNPLCDRTGGQGELENMSMAVYALSLGARYLSDQQSQCLHRVSRLLEVFFVDPDTRMDPRVEYAQTNPSLNPPKGDEGFAVTIRYLTLVSQSLSRLPLDLTLVDQLRSWFTEHLEWMESSAQGDAAKRHGNNITFWYHVDRVSALFAIDPERTAAEAAARIDAIIRSYPTPEHLFAREISRTRPRHYTLFALEPIFILASFASSPAPPANAMSYLRDAVLHAASIQPGSIERPLEEGGRYEARLAWFERMLSRWNGEVVQERDPDGQGWSGGWNMFCRLEWALI